MKRPKVFAWSVLCFSLVLMVVMGLMENPDYHTPAFWVGAMGYAFLGLLSFGFLIANGDLPLTTHDKSPATKEEISFGIIFLAEDTTDELAEYLAKSMPKSGIREDDGE